MVKNDVLDFLANNPDILLEIIGEILEKCRNNIDQSSIVESKKQLIEISKLKFDSAELQRAVMQLITSRRFDFGTTMPTNRQLMSRST